MRDLTTSKVNNEEIAKKWQNEAVMADCCINELPHIASVYSAFPGNLLPIFVYNGDIVKSDTVDSLQDEVQRFEGAIPGKMRDWRPGSDEKSSILSIFTLSPGLYHGNRHPPIADSG
jgi:hypothetical protein